MGRTMNRGNCRDERGIITVGTPQTSAMSNFSAAQLAPRTGRAIAFAIGMMVLVQAGFMVLDLALRKLLGATLGEAGLYVVTLVLLGLGAFVGIVRACVRYPYADRSAVLASVVGFEIALGGIGVWNGAGLSSFGTAVAIHSGYTLAQIVGGAFAVKLHPRRSW